MNSHGGMDPRLLQGLYFGCSQGLDKLPVIYEFICGIGILCVHDIEGYQGIKILSYQVPQRQAAGSR